MTSVDKLLIQGIRSFSPQNRHVIDFYKPLTIIVGQNGAGKTTIIECLKFATTGELPPNSKNGQAFVHDPKVAGEREVKAQIKMRFCSASGKPVVSTRSLQLTQKPNKQELKTLESAVQTVNSNGEKVSHSYRCADIDREIPELMGVSKPILENVIFCHQEDSNWPLGESTHLKKRFEDIFATTGYTKALEAIRKQRKEKLEAMKELKHRVESLQTKKLHVQKLRDDLAALHERKKQKKMEIMKLKEQVTKAEKAIAEKRKIHEAESQVLAQLQARRAVLQASEKQCAESLASLEQPYSETDEELEALHASFDERIRDLEQRARSLEEAVGEIRKEKVSLEQHLERVRVELESEKRAIENRKKLIEERDAQIIEFAQSLGVPGASEIMGPLSPSDVEIFFQTLAELERSFEAKKAAVKDEANPKLSEWDAASEKLKSEITSLEATTSQNRKRIAANVALSRQKETKLEEQRKAVSELEGLELKLKQEEVALASLKEAIMADNIEEQIETLSGQRQAIRDEIGRISEAMRSISAQSSLRYRVQAQREQLQKAKRSMDEAYTSAEEERFAKVLSHPPAPSSLHQEVETLAKDKSLQVKEMATQLQRLSNELSSIVGQQTALRETLDKLHRTAEADLLWLEEKNARLAESHDPRPFPIILQEAETKLEQAKRDIAFNKSAELMYLKFSEMALEKRGCPLCDRGFDRPDGVDLFREKIASLVREMPQAVVETEARLQNAEALRNKLVELRPHWEEVKRIEKEIPELTTRLSRFEEERTKLQASVETVEASLQKLKNQEQELRSLIPLADRIQRLHQEVLTSEMELKKAEKEVSEVSSDTRTLEEVQCRYNELAEESERVEANISALRRKEREATEQKNRKETEINNLRKHVVQKVVHEDHLKRLEKELSDLQEEIRQLECEIQRQSPRLETIKQELVKLVGNQDRLQAQVDQQLRLLDTEKSEFLQRKYRIDGVVSQLRSGSSEEDHRERIAKFEEEKQSLEKRIDELETKAAQGGSEAEEIRKQLQGSEIFRRNIADNLKHRKKEREVEELRKEIREREANAKNIAVDQLALELSEADRALKAASAMLHSSVGSRNTIQEAIARAQPELSKGEYATVDADYRKAVVELKTTELAANDLDKYYKALDKALMEFHSLKMEEINKIVKELWQATYKSNDIDTIEIRSEAESQTTTSTKARSYNYRVVMVKGDTELDMRGRCSAGQKVLASLIIRLALAETFCVNCGILALDEPTTNLDRVNVESLAKALVQIIESRRRQSNFQLIVITHDEDFVQLLGRSEYADYYWRVYKDANQHSAIERQDIRDLE